MKKIFSLSTLVQITKQCTQRFSITLVFITILTIYWLAIAWTDKDLFPDKVDGTIIFYLAVGILLTTVLQLWGEEVKNRRTKVLANAVAHIALLADSAYIYSIYDKFNMEVGLAHASIITALTLCMFILPFFREKDDIASWNFTLRLLLSGCTSWIIGGIMCGGMCLLTAAVEELFGINLSDNWIETWLTLFMFTLPALLFIGRIPAGEEKHDRTPRMSIFLHRSIHYLFLPLLGCYLIVLYGYLAKIIFEWQLPDGWVSTLVSVLTFGSIAVVLGLYPLLLKGTSKSDSRIVRFLPILILPLLVLMTVGIARRLDDYGITARRLYLLTLNIWFYLVCIGMLLTKARRVWWIPASFAAFFLLTSVLPINITSITRNWIYDRVETVIKSTYKGKLPMNEETYLNWLATLPKEEALKVNSRIQYLDWNIQDYSRGTLVTDTISYWNAERYINDRRKDKADSLKEDMYYSTGNTKIEREVKFDSKYASIIIYNDARARVPHHKNSTKDIKSLNIPIYKNQRPIDTLEINFDDLRKWDAQNSFTPQDIQCRKKGNRFILTSFNLEYRKEWNDIHFNYTGYYMIKKR